MKYDLVVVGGGPGGLMAAKTAAEDGLKVLLVERKKNVAEINRTCLQIFYINKITPNPETGRGEAKMDGYIDPVSVEILPEKGRLNFPVPGFELDFEGSLRAYYNWVQMSPSGNKIHRYLLDKKVWGFYYQKEALVASLLSQAEKAGVEVLTETLAVGAENTADGVDVRIKRKQSEETLKSRYAIAADGLSSRVVQSLGLNENRNTRPARHILAYVLDGVTAPNHDTSLLSWTIPSLSPGGNIWLGLMAEGRNILGVGSSADIPPATILDKFLKLPAFHDWFSGVKIVDKKATAIAARASIKEPVSGNVVIIGDAGASAEAWVQGALASGYQAVKAIEKERDGQPGYREYIDWWQHAFAFNNSAYQKLLAQVYPLNRVCNDDDIDYLFGLFKDEIGIPALLVTGNLERVEKGRPELYQKLKANIKSS
jgi:flavin-dependent dehydrogenase